MTDETTQPEVTQPEATQPEVTRPEAGPSEATAPAPEAPAPDAVDIDAMAEEALQSASNAAAALEAEVAASAEPQAVELPSFGDGDGAADEAHALSMLNDVDLQVKVELGRTRMYVEDVLRLDRHSVVELDKAVGDPVDIFVNGRLIARGEVLVLDDNFCVRVSEIVSREGSDENGK